MIIAKQQARELMAPLRQVKRELKKIIGECDPCDRSQAILAMLDCAELLVADETTHEYREPKDVITLRKMIKALVMYREDLMERVTGREETNGLF